MPFNSQLRKIRNDKHLTQSDVAKALEITLRQYQRYESGEQTPTFENLIALADFLQVSLDYLCDRDK